MIISYINLLPIENPHAITVDIGITIKPIPVNLNVIELVVVAIITTVSIDFFCSYHFIFFVFLFRFVVFIFEVCNHLFDVTDMVIKTLHIV